MFLTWRKVYCVTSFIICLIGLIIQVHEVSDTYLKFEIESRVAIIFHEEISVPAISACFRKYDIMNFNAIKNKLHIDIKRHMDDTNWDTFWKLTSNLTIANYFEFTPKTNQLLGSKPNENVCYFKLPSYPLSISDEKECYDKLDIKKYHHRNMICYRIQPNIVPIGTLLHVGDYAFESERYGIIYYLSIGSKYFKNVKRISIYIHEPDSSEIIDSYVAHYSIINGRGCTVRITYHSINAHLLEPPYETKCSNYPRKDSQTNQIMKGIHNDLVRMINKSYAGYMIYDAINTTILQFDQLQKNETLRSIYRNLVNYYRERYRDTCDVKVTNPRINIIPYERLMLSVNWPDGFHIKNEARPKINLMDYVIYISSCIGIWFGLSAFQTLNSFKELNFYRINGMNDSIKNEKIIQSINHDQIKGIVKMELVKMFSYRNRRSYYGVNWIERRNT